jgi:hypothetical protein
MVGLASGAGSSDQRPATVGGAVDARLAATARAAEARPRARRARDGGAVRDLVVVDPSRDRSGASVSLVTRPAHTRSQSAFASSLSSTAPVTASEPAS